MSTTRIELSPNSNSVVAVFPDGLFAFEMPRGATFADLAERLFNVGQALHEEPISIAVRTAQ